MNKYIGITIGPIYETMKDARKTRELWNASYLFSFFMKRLLAQITNDFKDWSNVLVPYLVPSEVTKPSEVMIQELKNKINQKGVGLFHDRIVLKYNAELWNYLKDYVDIILSDIARIEAERLEEQDTTIPFEKVTIQNELYCFYKNYIRLYMVVKEIPDSENPLLKINESLNNLELHASLPIEISNDKNYLQTLLLSHTSFLKEDGFVSNHSFLSIPEIATHGLNLDKVFLKEMKSNDNDSLFYKELISNKKFQHYHKYIAIVNADGDSITKVIEEMYQEGETGIKKFSKLLFEYAIQAKEKATEYGASVVYAGGDDILFDEEDDEESVVYAGGDDILFFAPVKANDKTIFDLCFDLRKLFVQKLKDNQIQAKASLSFGVSITYYKYPLYEANKISHDLLMESKKIEYKSIDDKKNEDKNAITVQIIKHSGQKFKYSLQFDIDKDDKNDNEDKEKNSIFAQFLNLLNSSTNVENSILRNIYTKFYTLQSILKLVDKDEQLDHIFDNEFDKSIHKNFKPFLDSLKNLLRAYRYKHGILDKKAFGFIHGALKTLDFYTSKEEPKNETSN